MSKRSSLFSTLRVPCIVALGLAAVAGTSCGTMKNGQRWGEDVALRTGLDRIGHSALHAAIHPATWVPALGAAVFAINDFDRKVSDWAGEETPVFGSQTAARDVSNILLGSMGGIAAATIVATPSGKEAKPWLESKGKGLLVEGCAIGSALGMTEALKAAVGRTRPDQSDSKSFPSGHATAAFSLAALTSGNIDSIALRRGVRTGLKAVSYAMGVTVGWARIESLSHFPSDVLAGAAIGHFLTVFIHDAFLGPSDEAVRLEVEVVPSAGGGIVFAYLSF